MRQISLEEVTDSRRKGAKSRSSSLPQLSILRFRLLQDRNIRVRVLP
jgi:hypothetical protein